MRKYKRKAIAPLKRQYASNDPLRWVHVSSILGINRPMTKRERRIFIRRTTKSFKTIGLDLAKAMETFVGVMTNAAKSVAMLFNTFQNNPDKYKLELNQIRVEPLKMDLPAIPSYRLPAYTLPAIKTDDLLKINISTHD